jgi:hypothetical protein
MSAELTVQPRPDYYVPGGALKSNAPSYVERQADTLLLENVRKGEFCYVLTPRQMGKTSLMVRTSATLRASGVRTVIVDLTQLGTKLTAEQWYLGQVMRVAKDLELKTDYLAWWQQQSHLGHVQRFVNFLVEVALGEVAGPVVVFVDEIDTTLDLSFSDDFFAAIRSLYIQRAIDNRLDRLTFVLLGVASPSDLIRDAKRTPFNIGVRIPLTDFSESEASVLAPGLAPDSNSASQLLKGILFWTGGHPYLTQKTCKEVANWAGSPKWDARDVPLIVDETIKRLFFSEQGRNQDFNLQFVRDRILESGDSVALLEMYSRIRRGETIIDDELDPVRVALKLSGLVLATDGRILKVRNRIYDRVFDDIWINSELRKRSRDPVPSPSILERVGGWFGRTKSDKFKYDVFLSYSRRDSEWVKGVLAPNLRNAGLSVCVDPTIEPGNKWLREPLGEGLPQSRCIVLVMSPDYFASPSAQFELELALRLLGDSSSVRRIIPLLLKSTEIPAPLKPLASIDFRQHASDGTAMSALLGVLGVRTRSSQDSALSPSITRVYDTGVLRKLLDEALDADDLNAFVYDYFRPLREVLDAGETKKAKIQFLIESLERTGELDRLLDLMARDYPAIYRRYVDLLLRQPS